MPSWTQCYNQKKASPAKAVSTVKSGDRVYIGGNAATPMSMLHALLDRKEELYGVQLSHVLLLGDSPLVSPGMEAHFRHNSLFVGPSDRDAVNQGRADYVPVFLHRIPPLFRAGRLPLDVAIVQTSPPDDHGYMSFGVEVLASKAACEHAKVVIVQANDKMPRTLGDSFIHVSQVHHIVETSESLPTLPRAKPSDLETRIGQYVASLIKDGDTLQLGIGSIPDAILSALGDKKDLGVHTEMVSDGIVEAMEAGIITGARKNLHKGKVVGTFALGSSSLYAYLHNNPAFEFHPVDYTNDPFVVARNDNFVSVNSALEVDLSGQVCADSIGSYIYSGFGGQVDFVRGATQSSGGKSIIALPSTARSGTVSRLVPFLKPGAGVVTTRADVQYVVTEFGIADLQGRNLRERAQALVHIAHPQFRPGLEEAARKNKWYSE
jgi:acyl-CoA hydrolase